MPNKDPIGRSLNNQVQSNRFANKIIGEAGVVLAEMGQKLESLLRDRDPTVSVGANRIRRLRALNAEARDVIADAYKEIESGAAKEFASFGELQAGWAVGNLERYVAGAAIEVGGHRLGRAFWTALLAEDPTKGGLLVQGDSIHRWWVTQGAAAKQAFTRQVQLGMAEQEAIDDIVRRVRGRYVRGKLRGGVIGGTTREATALVRTAVNQIANRAHKEVYADNRDITGSYQYLATLDARTTLRCITLDGQIFEHGKGPYPPQHWSCRSTTVPVINWEALGLEPPAPGIRASKGKGTYSSAATYSDWLKNQPKGTVDKVLGPARSQLFRDGRVSLRDLVRRDGTILNLDQLRERITA